MGGGCGQVPEFLEFSLTLRLGDFVLNAAERIPLTGITALSGPSGSGKTTLLRTIAGLEPMAEGHVRFAGDRWSGLDSGSRKVGYVFQDARLFPHLDVTENLRYGAVRRGVDPDRVNAIVEALDLRPILHRMPTTLSGGEIQRVALGRALASGPRILLMDEPLAGLDQARKAGLMPYISRAVSEFGVPALYVTHSVEELAFLADRTLRIRDGKLDGWSEATPRLMGQVVQVRGNCLELAIGGVSVQVKGRGRLGETWVLLLGNEYLVSTKPPGKSNAALSLRAHVVEAVGANGHYAVEVEGQRVTLPWRYDGQETLEEHTALWLSLPRVLARPVWSSPDLR